MEGGQVRTFRPEDSARVSSIIHQCLDEVNRPYYPSTVIDYMRERTTPDSINDLAQRRTFLVFERDAEVLGVASLENNYIGSVFVDPQAMRNGIGTRLMDAIEDLALVRGEKEVTLGASLNAVDFYRMRGYEETGTKETPEYGKVHLMCKPLGGTNHDGQ